MQIRRTAVALTSAATLSLGAVAMTPASAAPDTRQSGLVNLALTDTTVQIPIALAANVCGVTVQVLAAGLAQGPVDCTTTSDGEATSAERGGAGTTRQQGLVNVAITDTTVQVPLAVALNLCGLTVNALSGVAVTGPVTCEALADATAGA